MGLKEKKTSEGLKKKPKTSKSESNLGRKGKAKKSVSTPKLKSKEFVDYKQIFKIPDRDIPTGSTIATNSEVYRIQSRLGSGGFGDVYIGQRLSDGTKVAVKVELSLLVDEPRLEKEYDVYRRITEGKLKNTKNDHNRAKHLMCCLDFGEVPNIGQFLMMPLCGPSLECLSKKTPFSTHQAFDIAHQALQGLEGLHSYGMIHRDIKPANFCYGIRPHRNTLYVIDFGMTTRYCPTKEKMPATSAYDFIGTMRYAPRTTHAGNPQSRVDDVESWLFLILEVFHPLALPWRDDKDSKAVCEQKEEFYKEDGGGGDPIFKFVGYIAFRTIAALISSTGPFGEPPYESIYKLLKSAEPPSPKKNKEKESMALTKEKTKDA